MLFKKLKLENIRSFENLEIEFLKGSTLLVGNIGSGKTSVLLGLQFALFGLQPGQKGASILRQGCDFARAVLELEIGTDNILLERTIRRSSKGSVTQDSNVITVNGEREELSTSEMKDRVVRLLNYPKEFVKKSNLLYKFTVYTPQEEMKAIVQERPEVRLDTLRHIFGIDRYKRIKDNAGIFLSKIKEAVKIKEVLASELNMLKEKLAFEGEKKIGLSRETNNLKIEYEGLVEKKEEAEEKLNLVQSEIDEKKEIDSEVSNLEVSLQGKKDLESRMKKEIFLMQKQKGERIDFSEERLRAVSELLEKHKKIMEDKNKDFLDICSKISVLESKKENPEKMKERVLSLENCPTCFQTVGREHKEKISKRMRYEIEEINIELEDKLHKKSIVEKDVEKEKELIKGYESDLSKLQQDRIKYNHQREVETKIKSDSFVLDRTTNEIEELKKKIEELKKRSEEFLKVQEKFDIAREEFKSFNEIVRLKEITLAEKNKELEILKDNLEDLRLEISKKEKIREDADRLRSLQNWISDKFIHMINMTEKNVMAKLRSEFSNIFSEWFSMLVSDSMEVRLDEDFTPQITNQGYEIDYDFLSGGERTAVALAYRLSLNQVLNSMLSRIKTKDIVILDEPTDGFSSEQIDKMRDIFDQLKAEQTILVSHEQKIEGFVDHVIRVRKEGVSEVEG